MRVDRHRGALERVARRDDARERRMYRCAGRDLPRVAQIDLRLRRFVRRDERSFELPRSYTVAEVSDVGTRGTRPSCERGAGGRLESSRAALARAPHWQGRSSQRDRRADTAARSRRSVRVPDRA